MISIICKIYSKFSQFLIFKRNRTFVTFCTWQQKCINVHCVKLVVWSLFYGFIFGLFHRSENDFLTRGLFNVDNQIVSVILNQEITTLNQTKLITLRSPWKSSVKIYPWKTYQSMKKKSTSNSSETWSQGYLRREISFKMGSQKLWNSPIITISRDIFEFFNKLNSWKLILLDKSFETRLYRKTLLKFRFPEKATTLITL